MMKKKKEKTGEKEEETAGTKGRSDIPGHGSRPKSPHVLRDSYRAAPSWTNLPFGDGDGHQRIW